MKSPPKRWWLRFLLTAAVIVLCLLRWGGDLLISTDPLPARVDAAIVLQGSITGERARLAGAMSLLQQLGKDLRSAQRFHSAMKSKFAVSEGFLQRIRELATLPLSPRGSLRARQLNCLRNVPMAAAEPAEFLPLLASESAA